MKKIREEKARWKTIVRAEEGKVKRKEGEEKGGRGKERTEQGGEPKVG